MCSDDLVGARYSQLEGGDEIRGLSSSSSNKSDDKSRPDTTREDKVELRVCFCALKSIFLTDS